MEWSYPWLSIDDDRLYDDGDFARFFAGLFSNGVSLTTADGLKVGTNPTGGMRVQVQAGAAFTDGRAYFNSTSLALPIDVASSTQDRTDSVVLQMNTGQREIKLLVKKGSVQVNRTDDTFELQLATILVPRNSSNITADLITDKRADETVCGYSTPFEKVSVSGMEEQYRAMLQLILDKMNAYADSSKEQFEADMQAILDKGQTQLDGQATAWQDLLNTIVNQLTDNQAINLQNQISKLTADKQVFAINHGLKAYPQVMVTAWNGGLGTVGIGEPNWTGSVPETIPVKIGYPSWNEIQVSVPVDYQMIEPVITETEPMSWLLAEGMKSMRIKILGGI